MADEEDVLEEDGEGGAEAPPKKGGGGGIVPKLLKFVAIGLGALIFIVTVVVITFNIMNGGGKQAQASIPQTESYVAVKPIYAAYDGIGEVSVLTKDSPPFNVAVTPVLQYDLNDNATQTELIARKVELQDFIRRYFSNKYAEELQTSPTQEFHVKNEIKELLNTTVLDKARVRSVLFPQFRLYQME
ncbi:MAG: flagellar basal body-associated FliL family protein [Spirochaetaceae bacterium]|jgi:flagellar FliL protein|nr:flagellar basal body-associated FliL family protein [Spirochaetaceae bacterium]